MVNSARPWTIAMLDGVKVGDAVRVFASRYDGSHPTDVGVARVTKAFVETVDGRRAPMAPNDGRRDTEDEDEDARAREGVDRRREREECRATCARD